MTKTAQVGNHVARVAMACYRKNALIHYSQGMQLRWSGINRGIHLPQVPSYADCSSLTTWFFWTSRISVRGRAGRDVVNNQGWKAGYTGTQINNGREHKYGNRFWKVGRTLVFYGRPHDATHVGIYVGVNRDKNSAHYGKKMVVSHGQESGPHYLPWNYRDDYIMSRVYRV